MIEKEAEFCRRNGWLAWYKEKRDWKDIQSLFSLYLINDKQHGIV